MEYVCRAEHIAIGSEILLGQIANGHARTVSLEFAKHGYFMYHHHAVGDNLHRIVEVISQAVARSNVIVITGGLGPTEDDLTREALAAYLGVNMTLDEAALETLRHLFSRFGRVMPEENKKQAMRLDGAEMLHNPNGTAPGQYVHNNGVHYFLLPGPPLEMLPMLQTEVIPRLSQLFPSPIALVSRVLHFCGIGESHVDEQIPDLLSMTNPTVAPLAGEGEMLLRITASSSTGESAWNLIGPVETTLRERFGPYIYGVDEESLPSAAIKALQEYGWTVGVAESCTGGMVSSMLTSIPGSSSVFLGGVVAYDNSVKEQQLGVARDTLLTYGAVSEQTARAMAEGVRDRCSTTFGIATTGIAGPGGGTEEKPVGLVYMAVAGPDGCRVYKTQYNGSREQIRLRVSKQVLWRLIRHVRERMSES